MPATIDGLVADGNTMHGLREPTAVYEHPCMKKLLLVMTGVLAVAFGVAIVSRSDLKRERARADALAERVATFEPVERGVASTPRAAPVDLPVERVDERPASDIVATQPTEPTRQFKGSQRARRQVEQLQAALARGTPLQDYQIQALLTAIDEIHEADATNDATGASSRERLVQAAADILFESQLETFIELLRRDSTQ